MADLVFNPYPYIGTFAGEAAALTYIRTRRWDDAASGLGNPTPGTMFYDSVASALKIYIGGAWVIIQTGSETLGMQFMDFWSEPQQLVQITSGASDVSLPNVVVPNITLGTFQRVVCMFKYRKVTNTNALNANKLSGDQNIRVKASGGAWGVDDVACINLKDDEISVAKNTDGPGDAIIGDEDVKGEVSATNDTYNLRIEDAVADYSNLELHDVQTGIRIYFK